MNIELARSKIPSSEITPQGDRWFFRFDTNDDAIKINEDVCWDLQGLLRDCGLEIEEPCIEHDCISGFLRPYESA